MKHIPRGEAVIITPTNINWVVEVTGRSRSEILKIQYEAEKRGVAAITTVLRPTSPKHSLKVDRLGSTDHTVLFRCSKCPYILPITRGRLNYMLAGTLSWKGWFGQTGTRCSS
jgi:hypothetical protein